MGIGQAEEPAVGWPQVINMQQSHAPIPNPEPANPASFRPLLVTKKQAASLLSVSVRTIENLLAQKALPFRKLGKRTLIPYSSVVQLSRRDVPVITGERLAS